jgi:sec-independent protein translocase protein TatC
MTSPDQINQPDDGLGGEQPFMSHLAELRDRLIKMIAAIVLVFLCLFPFGNDIYTFIAEPIRAQLPEGATMIATQVASPFLTPFKLSLVAAIFVAMPYLLYQLWAFVAPGLYRHEKRLALPLVSASILLFYLGMLFAYVVVFPLVFAFFTSVTPDGVQQMPDIAFYLEFVLKLFFAFGIAFQIPIATILLVAVGATTPEQLAHKRPYVIVGVFVAGMLLTPPDVISQTLLALPMWLLFELGILASRLFQRRSQPDDDAPEPPSAGDGPRPDPTDSGPPTPAPAEATPSAMALVGSDIDGGRIDEPGRYRPMTDAEMEAELDAIEAAEDESEEDDTTDDFLADVGPDPIEELLRQANRLRADGNVSASRHLLYRVLEEGDDDQRRVARNILADLDA